MVAENRSEEKRSGPRIALCTIAFRERLLADALDMAAQLGFPGVELWGREPHVSENYDYNRVRLVKKMCEERGLEIAALGSYVRFGATRKNSDAAPLVDTLQTARTLRTPIVRVWASDVPSEQADEKLWKRVVSEAREAAERSRGLGITLAVEMHDDTLADTADSARRLVEEVDCDNFRLNFQPSAWERDEDVMQRLEKVLPYVVHCHAQNFSKLATGEFDGFKRASLRDGLIDYRAIVDTLVEAGYCGWISVEFSPVEGDGKLGALADDLAFLKEVLGEVEKRL